MKKINDPELRSATRTIVLSMPRSKRREIQDAINLLCNHVNIDEDLINHTEQGKHWAKRPERESLEEHKEKSICNYKVDWRGQGHSICSIDRAAMYVRISANALRVRLSKGGGKAHFTIDDQVVTVSKIEKEPSRLFTK